MFKALVQTFPGLFPRRVGTLGGLLACVAMLVGCADRTNRVFEMQDPVDSSFAAGTPGEFTMIRVFGAAPINGRISADGTVTCDRPYPAVSDFFSDCRFTVEDDGSGRWRLFAAPSFVLSGYGEVYREAPTPDSPSATMEVNAEITELQGIEWRMQGYAPVTTRCQRDGSRYFSERTSTFFLLDIRRYWYFNCGPVFSVPDNSSNWRLVNDAPTAGLAGGQQVVTLRIDSDFPLDVQMRFRLHHVLGTVRADATCPLPGIEGSTATTFTTETPGPGLSQRRVWVDRNLLRGESGDAELLVRYNGEDPVGGTGLLMTADTATRRVELSALPTNDIELGPGTWLRLLRMPSEQTTLVMPAADRLEIVPPAFCWNDLVRVSEIRASATRATLRTGDSVDIVVRFDAPVDTLMAGRTALLRLETGASDPELTHVASADPHELRFRYTVQAGDQAERLDVFSRYALQVRDGDGAGPLTRGVDLSLPAPGSPQSLGISASLTVDGGQP